MTPERFEKIMSGAVEIWDVDSHMEFSKGLKCCSIFMEDEKISISHELAPFGTVWRIVGLDGKERVHPSLGSMLNSLSRILRPDLPNARVIFSR
ncbi:MAG: hypothetical protein CMM58_05470 [Rhodospirillaceae bacterium]|nr:hypothetical protein [Rhodospirillaceae bacterium]|tara:strand:+ start:1719 stop:2000 length:282 start_codon:yes stop_codon:yes gene_type:complete